MAWTFSSGDQMLLVLSVFFLAGGLRSGHAASFKFTIHHRFSDSIKEIFGSEGLAEKHTPGYYAAMVHRDRLLHGRNLANTNGDTPLMFSYGNETYRISGLGNLYYANVSIGTPGLYFLVALDTGSNLFWLPCECTKCRTYLTTRDNEKFWLNHYSSNASSTSIRVPCSSSLCEHANQCSSNRSSCPYKTHYPSQNSSSAGYLVQDILHMATDDSQLKPVDAKVTLGCGKVQTGKFANFTAANGLIGLGMGKLSVPSFLASQGLTADSFSMCFGYYGNGRIDFGDIGSVGQRETPLNPTSLSYNVTILQIIVTNRPTNVHFTAIIDTGSSFTYLTDPFYSIISDKMDEAIELERIASDSDFPFEYCYQLSMGTIFLQPTMNFTMEGGRKFDVISSYVMINTDDGIALCLAIVKSTDINVIGSNLLSGYRVVFNREKMTLGWKEVVDCDNYGADTPSGESPPPFGGSPPPTSSPRKSNSTQPSPEIGTGDAMRLNPIVSLCVVILVILSVVV
uniref:Peptidase A1 domain-containing protein n=1 Tax=Cucumis melo TaxID=3656 RepID=A0A9I9CT73_CUCME